MKISIFGLGYVGCVSLGCLAKNGHTVIGVDIVDSKIDLINKGKPTIIEKEIDKIIQAQWERRNISATKDYIKAIKETEVSLICVGTPSTPEGHLTLDYVFNTVEQIAKGLSHKDDFHIIAIRSTVLPGTNFKVGDIIEKVSSKKRNIDFAVVSNPEFLREGSAVSDYYNPPFTALGCDNQEAIRVMKKIYDKIDAPIEVVDIKIAELIKYVSNSFHALKIAFTNEIGNICKKLDVNSHEVMNLFTKDTQLNISPVYLKPGFAYGGSCLPKDLKGLRTLAHDHYLKAPVLDAIEVSNEYQKEIVFQLIQETGKKRVGILGLSFKYGTDDLRYSPIVELAEKLLGKGYQISVYDKNVIYSNLSGTNKVYIEKHIPHIQRFFLDDIQSVIQRSEVIVISHYFPEISTIIKEYPNKLFVDLVKISDGKSGGNYLGISW